ncbi:MAG: SMC-Scp complex subunit ScpB [Elusimicrobia bacterium]|nr:SMC-Scp complex subunit ScpB [Elusimicrobiota bacterium]
MDNTELKNIIEAMLFISGSGVSAQKIASITEEELSKVNSVLSEIEKEYAQNHGIFLEEVGGKWKFTTKPQYAPWLLKLYPWKGILKISPSQQRFFQ